jgi:hypothetical protein
MVASIACEHQVLLSMYVPFTIPKERTLNFCWIIVVLLLFLFFHAVMRLDGGYQVHDMPQPCADNRREDWNEQEVVMMMLAYNPAFEVLWCVSRYRHISCMTWLHVTGHCFMSLIMNSIRYL